jgi:sec-independent protein translocase protein TatA
MPFINGGHIWLVLALLAVLVIFGPGKLPALGSAVGKTLTEFRKSTSELKDEIAGQRERLPAAERESARTE